MSRSRLSDDTQVLPTIIFGLIISCGSIAWLSYLKVVYPHSIIHFLCVTLIPPFFCGLFVGLVFRQRKAKIYSIAFVIFLSLYYPIFTILLQDIDCFNCLDPHYVVISCIFAGNILFVGMIKLVNIITFRYTSLAEESGVYTRNWYRFKEGKLFFATWTHFSILRLAPLIYFIVQQEWNHFYNVLAVFILSQGIALFFFFYWRKSRDKFHQSAQTEPSGTTSE